jgi:hypothetical protein
MLDYKYNEYCIRDYEYNKRDTGLGLNFVYFIQHCFICRASDSTVSEDAGIEPRTLATLALAVRRSEATGLDLSIIHPLVK